MDAASGPKPQTRHEQHRISDENSSTHGHVCCHGAHGIRVDHVLLQPTAAVRSVHWYCDFDHLLHVPDVRTQGIVSRCGGKIVHSHSSARMQGQGAVHYGRVGDGGQSANDTPCPNDGDAQHHKNHRNAGDIAGSSRRRLKTGKLFLFLVYSANLRLPQRFVHHPRRPELLSKLDLIRDNVIVFFGYGVHVKKKHSRHVRWSTICRTIPTHISEVSCSCYLWSYVRGVLQGAA